MLFHVEPFHAGAGYSCYVEAIPSGNNPGTINPQPYHGLVVYDNFRIIYL